MPQGISWCRFRQAQGERIQKGIPALLLTLGIAIHLGNPEAVPIM